MKVIECEHCKEKSDWYDWEGRYDDDDECFYYKCPKCGKEQFGGY